LSETRDFWLSCGHHLLDRDPDGRLAITDEFLKAYLARPEIAPPPEACAAERALHGALLADPRRPVRREEVAALADADARENWEVMIAFRDQLARHATLEAAYLDAVRRNVRLPHLFVSQMVHAILRNILDGCGDAFMLRAAEMLFRSQKLTLHEGSLVAADEETVSGLGRQPLSPLVSMLGLPAAAEIDVLNEENADSYWERSDRFDMALDLTAGRYGLAALGEVLRRWVGHLLGAGVKIEPLTGLQDAPLVWYVGLDAEGTGIGDALWNGEELDEAARGRVVALYRLHFEDANDVEDRMRGESVYLIGAMTPDKVLRLKPQNLITGLPVRRLEVVN
jgi:hypothetical protein